MNLTKELADCLYAGGGSPLTVPYWLESNEDGGPGSPVDVFPRSDATEYFITCQNKDELAFLQVRLFYQSISALCYEDVKRCQQQIPN